MDRVIFTRVVTTQLRRMGVPDPEVKAAAIAAAIEIAAETLGEASFGSAGAPPASDVMAPRPAFPSLNPEAVAPVQPEPPAVFQPLAAAPEPPKESLIIPATTITDRDVRKERAIEPLRALKPQPTMKVEELSQFIQDRTPERAALDIPMEDGSTRKVTFERNVISMHADGAVRLVYYPRGTPPSMQEEIGATADLYVDEAPHDMPAVLQKLAQDAVASARPRGAPREVPVRPFSGPVTHRSDEGNVNSEFAPQAQQLTNQSQAVFKSLG